MRGMTSGPNQPLYVADVLIVLSRKMVGMVFSSNNDRCSSNARSQSGMYFEARRCNRLSMF